jgi:hypothetical protein
MKHLDVTITNETGAVTGEYTIECVNRPGLDVEKYDSLYTINLIRTVAERHHYLDDFVELSPLSMASVAVYMTDPVRVMHLNNVNELWFEIENLMRSARLNFASSRMLKQLEDEQVGNTDLAINARFDLHLDKMEKFHQAVFEMIRVEDLIVRLVFEFFGDQFIRVDTSKPDWEKKLTWDRMKVELNKRGKPHKNPHPALEAMGETEYQTLMHLVRSYRCSEVLALTKYRDIRTHRVSPSVDHPELAVTLKSETGVGVGASAQKLQCQPEYRFLDLYEQATKVYRHLAKVLLRLNEIIHA